jgi:hypothetical protein
MDVLFSEAVDHQTPKRLLSTRFLRSVQIEILKLSRRDLLLRPLVRSGRVPFNHTPEHPLRL